MPLVPIITPLTFSSDADTATIPDSTVYGGANPERNTLAVYLELWKMDEDSVATELTVDNDDPANVESWDFDSSDDGWYKARIYIIPVFNILTSYTVGQVVFYNDSLYICINNSLGDLPSNTTFFSPLSDFSDAASANNVTTAYQDYLVIEHGKKCAGDAAGEWYKSKDCSNCDKMDLMSSMLQKRAMVITAQRFASISQYNKAEAIARKLETSCESC